MLNTLKGRYEAKFAKHSSERVSFSHIGCGHCQNAKPKFLKASEAFADEPSKAFTTVDCTQDSGKSVKIIVDSWGIKARIRPLQGNEWCHLIDSHCQSLVIVRNWRPMGRVWKDVWNFGKCSVFPCCYKTSTPWTYLMEKGLGRTNLKCLDL